MNVGLLTGGTDWAYSFGLTEALTATGVTIDFVGSDALANPMLLDLPNVNFLNLRGSRSRDAGAAAKVARVLVYYGRLLHYAAKARPRVFHILWNNKFELIDRTLLMIYYKLLR